jgi:hypothetical protein
MKVGIILECGKDGPEHKVLQPLVPKLLPPSSAVVFNTLGNKPNVLRTCGPVAAQLFKENCDRVLVLWDLWPAWNTASACRFEDRQAALKSLNGAKVNPNRVHLICIEQMLESWLLSDERALIQLISKWKHPRPLRKFRVPAGAEFDTKPKSLLTKLFKEQGCREYNDLVHAHQISSRWPNLERVARVPSFRRFANRLTS